MVTAVESHAVRPSTVEDVKVQLSGQVDVEADGQSVDLGPAKCRAVLAALAVSAGRPVPVSTIIDLVWGDDPPRTADRTLQSYVTRLRKALGEGTIERTGSTYRLVLEPDAVDILRFEHLVAQDRVAEALELWSGPPLSGLDVAGFERVIVRFTELYVDTLERHLGDELKLGNGPSHLATLSRLTTEHPLREHAWALRIHALYQAGRQAEALRAYAEARNHLVGELGIEPGQVLRDLEARILAQDPTLDAASPPERAEAGPSMSDSGTRTFLYTDIEDSTGLWDRNTDEMRRAVAHHDEVIAEAVEHAGGVVFKHTGDGALAVFETADEALNAAVAMQLTLSGSHVGEERFKVRIALSTGRADSREGDWFGPPLNIASRLLDAAHGDQILLGDSTYSRLTNQLEHGISTTELGDHRLRGLSRPERVHQVLHSSLPNRFPPLRTALHDDSIKKDFPSALSHAGRVTFVGRLDELGQIEAAWAEVERSNIPMIVAIGGEPGVGKTRLAGEAARRLHEEHGAMVVYGRCPEDHATAFRPVTEALTAYADRTTDAQLRTEMGPRSSHLTPVLPHLAHRFGDVGSIIDVTEETRLEIFDAVTKFLEAASTSPLVIVLDDVHWADQSSLGLVTHLARHLSRGRLLILLTYRDVEVERSHPLGRVLADLRREARALRLKMRGIAQEDSIEMTEAVLGHRLSDQGRAVVARITDDAGGNPFFLQEMLNYFKEAGVLVRRDGRWTAGPDTDLAGLVPEGIREVVGRRLDQVSDACNTLLRFASVLPAEIDFDVLVAAARADEDAALDLFDEALQAQLIVETAPTKYEFAHALIRQSLYAEVSTVRRLRMHRRIAEAMVATGRTDDPTVQAIAFHLLEAATAAEPELVARWGLIAGERAVGRFAYDEARDLFRRTLDVIEDSVDDATLFGLHANVALAEITTLNFDAALSAIDRCRRSLPSVDSAVAGRILLTVAGHLPGRSHSLGTNLALAELIASLDRQAMDPLLAATVEFELSALTVGRYAAPDVDTLVWVIESTDDATRARALMYTSNRIFALRELEQLTAVTERCASDATSVETRDTSQAILGLLLGRLGQFDRMGSLLEAVRASPIAASSRNVMYNISRLTPFPMAIRRGDLPSAAEFLDAMRVDAGLGELIDAYATRLLAWVRDEDLPPVDVTVPGIDTFLLHPHMWNGPPSDEAIGIAIVERPELGIMCCAADAAGAAGNSNHTDQIWETLTPARGQHATFQNGFVVSAVDYHLAVLAEQRGDLELAIELQLHALDQHMSHGFVFDQAMSTAHLIGLLRHRAAPGDGNEIDRLRDEALAALGDTELARPRRLVLEA